MSLLKNLGRWVFTKKCCETYHENQIDEVCEKVENYYKVTNWKERMEGVLNARKGH